jgi:hypothetical protein
MKDDPCFRCTLPECDDRSRSCEVRRLHRSYCSKVRNGQHEQITDQERLANNRIFDSWHFERAAEASEGGRPYRRGKPKSSVVA